MATRIEDKGLGKVLYLFSDEEAACREGALLGRGHLERFKAVAHSSGLGWYVEDKESGRLYDVQGLVR